MTQHIGIIVKTYPEDHPQAGERYVPFDADVWDFQKAAMLLHLAEQGHTLAPQEDGSVLLVSGPLARKLPAE